jgi:diguanylate cyclase (GGDEF)-like protein
LTQFYNASYLDEVLRRLDSTPDDIFAVMYVDLDGLKMVNDTYGHRVGDAFIRAAARLVAEAAGPGATLFRPYGDEFVAIGEPSTLVEAPATLARLTWKWNRTERASLFAPTPEGFDASPSLTMSAGVAVRTPGQRAVEVLQAAEARMYQEKKAFYGMWEGAQEEGRDPTSPGQPTEGPPQTRP